MDSFPPFLDPDFLRERFARPERPIPVTAGDGHLWRGKDEIRPAAVLVPVVTHPGNLTLLFTRRAAHLNDHAGQISFPGGRSERHDPSPAATALREAQEEIGLRPERVEVIGTLPDYLTVTGYRVTPVVGLVEIPLELEIDRHEVAEVFEMPLQFLLDPRNQQRNTVVQDGRRRRYYAIPYGRHYIWGATAGMLMNFCALLRT